MHDQKNCNASGQLAEETCSSWNSKSYKKPSCC